MNKNKMLFSDIQENIGVNFENIQYLSTALTHSSFINQKNDLECNERLEFLGDSVLQLSVSEYLFNRYAHKQEGELTRSRAMIVCENSLFQVGSKWNIGKFMLMSKGEEITGGRSRTSIIADCTEAIIAAVYLDKGYEFAKEFIIKNFITIIEKAVQNELILDHKTKLQETLQKHGEVSIEYKEIGFEGPPHNRKFFMEVFIDGKSKGKGEGYSKKDAEQNAAKNALIAFGDING